MQTEGIWISNPNTPLPSPYMPGTPVGSLPASSALKPSNIRPVGPALETLINSPMVSPLSEPSISTSRISSELELPPNYTSQPQLRGGVHTPGGIYGNQPFMDNAPQPQHGVLRGHEKRSSFHARIFGQSRTPIVPSTRETILDIPKEPALSPATIDASVHLPTQPNRASRMKRMSQMPLIPLNWMLISRRRPSSTIIRGVQAQNEPDLQRQHPYECAGTAANQRPDDATRQQTEHAKVDTGTISVVRPIAWRVGCSHG